MQLIKKFTLTAELLQTIKNFDSDVKQQDQGLKEKVFVQVLCTLILPDRQQEVKKSFSPVVKWLSLLTLNQASEVRILAGELFYLFPHLALPFFFPRMRTQFFWRTIFPGGIASCRALLFSIRRAEGPTQLHLARKRWEPFQLFLVCQGKNQEKVNKIAA